MKAFWQNEAIVWSEGIKQMDLVMKDNSACSGHVSQALRPREVLPDETADDGGSCDGGHLRSQPTSPSASEDVKPRKVVEAGQTNWVGYQMRT